MEESIKVYCGSQEGLFVCPVHQTVTNRNARVELAEGSTLSPTEFEILGGKRAAKKWKKSLKIILEDGRTFSIGEWLVEREKKNIPVQRIAAAEKEIESAPIEAISMASSPPPLLCIEDRKPYVVSVFPFVQVLSDHSLRHGAQPVVVTAMRSIGAETVLRVLYGNEWNGASANFMREGGCVFKAYVGNGATTAVAAVHVDDLDVKIEDFLEAIKMSFLENVFPTFHMKEVHFSGYRVEKNQRWSAYISEKVDGGCVQFPIVVHVS